MTAGASSRRGCGGPTAATCPGRTPASSPGPPRVEAPLLGGGRGAGGGGGGGRWRAQGSAGQRPRLTAQDEERGATVRDRNDTERKAQPGKVPRSARPPRGPAEKPPGQQATRSRRPNGGTARFGASVRSAATAQFRTRADFSLFVLFRGSGDRLVNEKHFFRFN